MRTRKTKYYILTDNNTLYKETPKYLYYWHHEYLTWRKMNSNYHIALHAGQPRLCFNGLLLIDNLIQIDSLEAKIHRI